MPHYWVLDPIKGNLRIYQTTDGRLVETMNLFREDGLQRLPRFEAWPLSVAVLLGDEVPEEEVD